MTAPLIRARAGLAALAALAVAAFGLSSPAAAQKTPEEALLALTEGNRRFASGRSVPQPVGEGVRRTLARGQSPFAVVVCCADSRVPPEHVFNCGLGELFVIRVAAHTCDRATLASIEYAVEHLNAPLCVVLGHEKCGAVTTAIRQLLPPAEGSDHDAGRAPASPAIRQLVEQLETAVRKATSRDLGGKALHDACEEEHVHHTVQHVLRTSPLLRRYVKIGRLQVTGARYHLQSGLVEWLPSRPLPNEHDTNYDPDRHAVPVSTPPHVALRLLQAGHRRFLGDSLPTADLSAERREALTHGEQPLAIVLTDADSRISPEHVFDAGLGELVVVRLAGSVVSDNVLATLELAATRTGASLLLVMGNTRDEAMQQAAARPDSQELSPHQRALLTQLEPAIEVARRHHGPNKDPRELVPHAVAGNVLRTVGNLRARSKVLRDLERRGRFAILPTVYDVGSGDLAWLKSDGTIVPDHEPHAAPGGETAVHGEPAVEGGHGDGDGHGDGNGDGNGHDHGHGHGHDAGHGHGDDHGHGGHGDDHGHGDGDGHDPAPVLDWGAAMPTASDFGHGDSHSGHAGHGSPGDHPGHGDGHDGYGGHGDGHGDEHGHGHGDDHDPHAAHEPHAARHGGHGERGEYGIFHPITFVGFGGILSLLLAAVIAMKK